jgi:hypothetical protein
MEGLTVGRVVHYVAYGTPGGEYQAGAHRASIVAEVKDSNGLCTLVVFNPTGVHWNTASYDEATKRPGTWHWIERA